MATYTPLQLLDRHLGHVLEHLGDAFDGDVEGVHQARIATRRLREVVPLIDHGQVEQVADTLRAAGRHLGKVRELDVMSDLLRSMSDRLPGIAAFELHELRQTVRHRLSDARRDMVKGLESLDLRALSDVFADRKSRLWRWLPHTGRGRWVDSIWTRILDRCDGAVDATQRAPAVYFPQRSHRARIAVKKLRYALEVAADTDVWRHKRILKDLRRLQGILGEIHDRQLLADLVDASLANGQKPSPGKTLIKEFVEGEINVRHEKYGRRREWIFLIADACRRAEARRRWWPPSRRPELSTHRRDEAVAALRPTGT
jgi:CHAD domain-containing protein